MYEAPLRPGFDPRKYLEMLEHSYADMAWLREASRLSIAEYKGRRRNKQGSNHINKRPINALNQLVSTYLPYISAYKVVSKIRSRGEGLRAEAEFREYLTDLQLEAMEFADTDREIGLDAILSSFGAGKLINSLGAGRFKSDDIATDPGEIVFRRTPPEDIVFDPNARSIRSCHVIFDRYTADKDQLIDSLRRHGLTDKAKLLENLTPLHEQPDMVEIRGLGLQAREETSPTNQIVLWDAAIFDGNELYIGTLPHWDDTGDQQQWIVEPEIYTGGERGPHLFVSLMDVPNEPFGMSVADQMFELHQALQRIGEKAYKQIIKTKRVNTYKASQRQDADAIKHADDDEFVGVADPEAINEVISGGLLAEMAPGIEFMFGMLNRSTQNVDFAGGRGGGGGTATEQAIRDSRISKGFGDMHERMMQMRRKAIKRMNYWMDGIPTLEARRVIPGAFKSVELTYSNASRRSPYDAFEYNCAVVTAESLDPVMRVAKVREASATLAELMTTAQTFGGEPSVVPDLVADMFDLDEIRQMYPSRNSAMLEQARQSITQDGNADGERTGMGAESAQQGPGAPGRPGMTTQSGRSRRPIDNRQAVAAPKTPRGGGF